jgi:hypothetical protein
MFALHSDPSHSIAKRLDSSLAAIVYPNEAYPQSVFERIVHECRTHGLRVAGAFQHPAGVVAAGHCDVVLEDLLTGRRTGLFENRGAGATGCRLDVAALAEVTGQIERSLDGNPALLLLNKFGKVEAGGGGLIDLIAAAIDRGIPVIISVPVRNLDAWRDFAGDMSIELSKNYSEIENWLDRRFGVRLRKA